MSHIVLATLGDGLVVLRHELHGMPEPGLKCQLQLSLCWLPKRWSLDGSMSSTPLSSPLDMPLLRRLCVLALRRAVTDFSNSSRRSLWE